MYDTEIEEFISTLTLGEKEISRYRSNITEFISLYEKPTELNYQNFYQLKLETNKEKRAIEIVNRVRRFFEFVYTKETQITMPNLDTEEIIDVQAQPVEPVADLAKTEPQPQPEPEAKKSNRGRKKKEGNYTQRIMIYVTPEMEAQIDIISNALKTSKTEFIVKILEKHLSEYKEKISAFLEQQKMIQNLFSE